ncbi:MAG: sulfotransferase [Acidobacteria bacterium]|nr:sulfotransferase [Acidobacteriota bacterium]
MAPALPNFFIVGAPKAGTTSLHHYLLQHPAVYMSPIKEPCYFASEIRAENFHPEFRATLARDARELGAYLNGSMETRRFGGIVASSEDYCKIFRNVSGQTAIGEASVCYLWSPTAPRNIAARIPHARIVMILRDPTDRAFSQYLHGVTNGIVRCSFRQHIEQSLARPSDQFDSRHPFLEFGFYAAQLQRYLDCFPRQQIHIDFYEDYRRDTANVLAGILHFLHVEVSVPFDTAQKHLEARVPKALPLANLLKRSGLWPRLSRIVPSALRPAVKERLFRPRQTLTMDPADRDFLRSCYRSEVETLSTLLSRDLRAWLSAQV